jgi:hypothetical protein
MRHTRRLQFIEPNPLDIDWGIRAVENFNQEDEYDSDDDDDIKNDDDKGDDKKVPASISPVNSPICEALKVPDQEWAETFDEMQMRTWKNRGSTFAAIAHLFEATASEA